LICQYDTHTAQEPDSLFWYHAVMTNELAVHWIRCIACRGRLRNLGEDSSEISIYRVTITWQ